MRTRGWRDEGKGMLRGDFKVCTSISPLFMYSPSIHMQDWDTYTYMNTHMHINTCIYVHTLFSTRISRHLYRWFYRKPSWAWFSDAFVQWESRIALAQGQCAWAHSVYAVAMCPDKRVEVECSNANERELQTARREGIGFSSKSILQDLRANATGNRDRPRGTGDRPQIDIWWTGKRQKERVMSRLIKGQ